MTNRLESQAIITSALTSSLLGLSVVGVVSDGVGVCKDLTRVECNYHYRLGQHHRLSLPLVDLIMSRFAVADSPGATFDSTTYF